MVDFDRSLMKGIEEWKNLWSNCGFLGYKAFSEFICRCSSAGRAADS